MKVEHQEVMVTGAGGAMAQRVIKKLTEKYNVVAVDFRYRAKLDADIPSYQVALNKRDFEDIFRRHNITGIVHLGRLESYGVNSERRYNANVVGTQRLFGLALKYHVHQVLLLSTFHVYGASPYNPSPLSEATPLKASCLQEDLVDTVELENLANIYLWKYPELNVTILRPCHITGPGLNNAITSLLRQKIAPAFAGFSPMMQFIHVDDMARAIKKSFAKNKPGVYNVAPNDWIPYHQALKESGCKVIPIPSVPLAASNAMVKLMGLKSFPAHLANFFRYPVVLDGTLFRETFSFKPKYGLADIFRLHRDKKKMVKSPATHTTSVQSSGKS